LVENGFSGRFVCSGEDASNHYAVCTGGDCLGDIAAKLDAAICDYWDASFLADGYG
jgi:hypothetical protein